MMIKTVEICAQLKQLVVRRLFNHCNFCMVNLIYVIFGPFRQRLQEGLK